MKVNRSLLEARLKDTSQSFAPLANALLAYGYSITFQDDLSVILQAGNNKILVELDSGNSEPPQYLLSKLGDEMTLTEVRNILHGHPGFAVDLDHGEKITVYVRESKETPASVVKALLHE